MTKRFAVIGDVHGCSDELSILCDILAKEGIDSIFHVGDLVDRGPDSMDAILLCRERGVFGVMGNHESVLLRKLDALRAGRNVDSIATKVLAQSLAKDAASETYLRSLPLLHVDDKNETILVHGGLWPKLPLWKQPVAVIYAQLIHPERPGDVRWWKVDQNGVSEEENYRLGYRRWWELTDESYHVIYGHTVHPEPLVYNRTIGIDTGCVFGAMLTAVIMPEKRFIQVPAKRVYFEKDRHDGS